MLEGFRPMLFPNERIDPEDVHGTYLMSTKLDGIRCLFVEGQMLSRHFKPIRNVQLQKKFEHLKKLSAENPFILDGEIFSPSRTFQEISSYVMSMDKPIPDDLEFYIFEVFLNNQPNASSWDRFVFYRSAVFGEPFVQVVEQEIVNTPEQIHNLYASYLARGYEGAILKNIKIPYKFGRCSAKSGQGYKFKPFRTFEAKIEGIEQAFQAKPDSIRTINELGKSETSGKAEDREPVEKAASFVVKYNGLESKVTLAMTDAEKTEVWKHPKKYIGRTIEYKGMLIGAKDRVRHPVFLRFRDDING